MSVSITRTTHGQLTRSKDQIFRDLTYHEINI